jgi:integrase
MRGDGYVYQQGSRWWVGFYVGGQLIRKPARLPDHDGVLKPAKNETEALRFLRACVREARGGHHLGPQEERLTVAQLLDALEARAASKGLRSAKKQKSHAKALRAHFALTRAVAVTPSDVERYTVARQAAGKAAATVSRELELLRQAYRLAVRDKQLSADHAPHIELPHVENARSGFFEAHEVAALLPHLEPDLTDFVEWLFTTGMRKGEAAALTWRMLDRDSPTWRLVIPASITKNKAGRTLPVVGTARAIIERRLKLRRFAGALVFHRTSKGAKGEPVKAFDKAWRAALEAAELPPERLVHDLRRSAARHLRMSGASETEAMKITGHKTASMFRRYSIVSDDEAAAALLRRDAFVKERS